MLLTMSIPYGPNGMPPQLALVADVVLALGEAAHQLALQAARSHAKRRRPRRGQTLRPGFDTPLWNALSDAIERRLRTYGDQARLGRILGLPRQRVHEMCRRRGMMPDGERTLQLLLWLHARSADQPTPGERNEAATAVVRWGPKRRRNV